MQLQLDPLSSPGKMFSPRRCVACGRALAPSGYDWAGQWNDMIFAPALESWNRLWTDVWEPWTRLLPQGLRPTSRGLVGARPSDRGAMYCQPDECHCSCCIADADLVVYARVGESRVVPLVIDSHVRRRRDIELQLSDWTSHGETTVKVTGEITPPAQFTLEPCEERSVAITIRVEGTAPSGNAADRAPDVEGCKVYYADLRVKGCDIRPIRIAVAVLSRDCAPYRIDCQCGCC